MAHASATRRIGGLVLAVSATALAAGSLWAGPATGAGVEIGHWRMDESSGTVMHDSSPSALDGSIGSAVTIGGGMYQFPGWTGNVDGAGHLKGKVPAEAGAVKVPDPNDVLDPRTASFTVSLRIRSALLANGRLPTASGASYNIVQKARADDAGGFWKLELGGSGSKLGKLRWVLSDGAHSVVVTGKGRIDDGAWHTVVAERRGNQSVLTVDGASSTASAKSIGDIHPKGKYSGTMTVGKKPGSTDPKDAFAGWMKELVASR
jgi:Laminin G domain